MGEDPVTDPELVERIRQAERSDEETRRSRERPAPGKRDRGREAEERAHEAKKPRKDF